VDFALLKSITGSTTQVMLATRNTILNNDLTNVQDNIPGITGSDNPQYVDITDVPAIPHNFALSLPIFMPVLIIAVVRLTSRTKKNKR
jgi:hypothetical protein